MKILTDASGSLTGAYLIKAIQDSGKLAVASDIEFNCHAKSLADDFIQMPLSGDAMLWEKINTLLEKHCIDVVIPSLDETLSGWAKRKQIFANKGVRIFISDEPVVQMFQDKWKTYQFFIKNNIPTPLTSLKQEYSLIKPRFGRGSAGVFLTSDEISMEGNISQELIKGTEYTIDVFCDKNSNPIYIVPRKRLNVKDGKSTAGIVVNHSKIIKYVRKICAATTFIGPINIQCFETNEGEIKFIEINPRIAGGMALGFAATENWVKLMIDHFIYNNDIKPVDVKYGLKMMRYYSEVFTFD